MPCAGNRKRRRITPLMLEEIYEIQCPYCGADISFTPDPLGGSKQSVIDECTVCNKPIRFELEWQSNELIRFEAHPIDE